MQHNLGRADPGGGGEHGEAKIADPRIGPGSGDPNPGWYSQASVGRLIYRTFSEAPPAAL